jgi:hypothetical protein
LTAILHHILSYNVDIFRMSPALPGSSGVPTSGRLVTSYGTS